MGLPAVRPRRASVRTGGDRLVHLQRARIATLALAAVAVLGGLLDVAEPGLALLPMALTAAVGPGPVF